MNDSNLKTGTGSPEDTVSAFSAQDTDGKGKRKEKTPNNPAGKKPKKKKRGKKVIALIAVLLIAAVVAGLILMPKKAGSVGGGTVYSFYTVEPRSITASLTGTGTLQPIDYHNITASVTGDILSADFEEMDEVNEDDVLYVIDSGDLEDDIEDMQRDTADALKDYNDALEDYQDLKITSDYAGTVWKLYVEEGDTVQNGTAIAYIVDNDTMLLEIPFFSANADRLRVGSDAAVLFGDTGERLTGAVTEVSKLVSVNANNSNIRTVTISVANPGGITAGMSAYASVTGTDGVLYTCAEAGTFKYNEEKTVTASAMGEVDTLYVKEGDRVSKNTPIAQCSSETLDKQVEQYKKTYDDLKKRLDKLIESREDYIITAPISGTIVQKNYKELDTIGSSSMSSTTNLAVIYDMSKLTMDMNIDELDLSQIEVGQKVRITTDSVANRVFEGEVTKKSIVGSTTNGTTTYPVTVEIEGNDQLLPGMNVNAEIITKNAENVLAVPLGAVARGNRVQLLKGSRPDMSPTSEKPETELVEVTTGISDDDYIEITSGLTAGDIVVVETKNVASTGMYGMMMSGGGMPGGDMPGGEMPGGGMPGGNGGGAPAERGNYGGGSGGGGSGAPGGMR